MLRLRFRMPRIRKSSQDTSAADREALLALMRRRLRASARLRHGVAVVTALALVAGLLAVIPQLRRWSGGDAAPPVVREGPLPEKNTATSTTRQNKDGSLTTTVYGAPVNYRTADGSYQPIDSVLHPAGEGGSNDGYAWRSGANAFGVRFKDASDADFAEVRIGERTFRISAVGAATQKARVDGSRITYRSAYRSADLAYTVTPTGMRKVISLAAPDAPEAYVFRLSADDGGPAPTVRPRADGAYEVSVAPVPGPVFVIDPPLVQESAPDGDSSAPAREAKPELKVEQSGRDLVVTLRLDGEWLRAPQRRFPVLLDPSMTIQPNVDDASFSAQGWKFVSDGIFIGSDANHWRGAVQFDVSGLPVDARITDAKLGLYHTNTCVYVPGVPHCGGVDHVMDAHRMTSAWITTGTVAYDPTASGTYTLPAGAGERWMTWPITATVQGWVTGAVPNYGLLVKRRTEVANTSGPVPPGVRSTGPPTQLPKLDITYDSDAVVLAEPATLHSNGAALSWSQYTGPSGAPFDRYEVHRAPGSGIFIPNATTLLTTIRDRGTTTFRDTTAAPDKTFTYRVLANASASNARTVQLPPAGTARKVLQPGPAEARFTPIGWWPNLTNCANYGANSVGTVGARAEYKFRSALYFDLRDIPAGATITNATATLKQQWGPANSIRVQAHRITRPWKEGTGNSDDGGVECSGGATWYDADTGQNWTAQGGDIDQTAAAYLDLTGGASPQLHDFNLTGLVQSWVSGTAVNNGFMLRTADETLRAGSEVAYVTDDFTNDITLRPKLTVTYADGSLVHAPQTSLSAPGPGSTVRGASVRLAGAASDDRRVDLVEFLVDGAVVGQDNSAPFEITWNSTGAPRGGRLVSVRATDDAGNQTTSAAVTVNVDNSAPPGGNITAPAPGATITGPVTLSANPTDDIGVASVAFLIDGVQVGKPITSAPWSMTWDPAAPLAPSFNGTHQLSAAVTDTSGQVTVVPATAQTLTVNSTGTTTYKAKLTLNVRTDPLDDVFPQAMVENTAPGVPVQDPSGGIVPPEGTPSGGSLGRSLTSVPQNDGGTPPAGCPANAYCPTVNVSNESGVSWSSSPVQVWYRWYAPNGAIMFEGKSAKPFPNSFGKTGHEPFPLTIYPPALPPGAAQGTFKLRIDLYDPVTNTWFSSKGNPPIEHPVLVAKSLASKLGLERYHQYEGTSLGAGMSTLTNVANGDMLVRWSPFFAPGRGLSTMVDLTYNSLEDHSRSPAGSNFSLSISGLSRLGEPIDIHPNKADTISGRSNRWVEVTDGDGTTHRFEGTLGTDGVVRWSEPPGVNLYLRSLPSGDINRVWALTRPDKVTYFFDADGFPTSVEDRNGNKITYTYEETPSGEDPGGPKKRIIAVADAGGRQFTIDYYSKDEAKKAHVRGKIQQIKDHSGTRLNFFYYDDGNLMRLVQVGGTPTQEGGVNADGSFLAPRSFTFTYTTNKGDGPAIGSDDAAGTPARRNPDVKTPNQSTRLYSVIDPRGNETRFAYYRANEDIPLNRWKLKSRTDRSGQVTGFRYEPDPRITTVTAPMDRVIRYGYDTFGRVTSIVNPANETTSVQWTTDHKVGEVANESATPRRVMSFTYNDNGYLRTRTDELQRRTELTYYESPVDANDTRNHLSLLKTVTTPEGTATATPANDYQWLFEYDTPGNPRFVTDPTGGKTTYVYNQPGTPNAGTLASVADANGNPPTTFPTYDPSGQPTKIVDPLNNTLQIWYDVDGNVVSVQDPNHFGQSGTGVDERKFKAFFDYDSFGRLGRQSAPRSTVNLPGQLLWSSVDFDENDNVVRSMGAHDGTIHSDPDNGPVSTAVFDTMDRPTLITGPDTSADPLGERTGIGYDAAGRTVTMTTPRGMQSGGPVDNFFTQYGYDALDRVISQTEYGTDKTAGQTQLIQMCYDKAGDLRSVTTPRAGLMPITCPGDGPYTGAFTTRMDYDLAHQPTDKYDPLGHRQKTTRDRNGNVKTVEGDIEPGRTSFVEVGYDQADRPITVRERFDSTGRMLTTRIEYDKNGNKIRMISPRGSDKGGASGPWDYYVTVNSYDALNRLTRTQQPYDGRDGTEKHFVHNSYDPNGNLAWTSLPTTQSDPNAVAAGAKTVMTYFDPGWIRTADDPANPAVHFDYTAQGRQKSRTPELANTPGTLDTEHRMTWEYYLDGMVKSRNNRMGHPITFVYDANNNLKNATATGGATGGGERPIETEATFDGFDRITKTRSRKNGDTTWTFTTYSYDENNNVKVRLENGQEGTTAKAPRRYELTYDGADWLVEQRDLGVDSACKDDSRIVNEFWANGLEKKRETYRAGATCTADVGTWPKKQTTTWSHNDNSKLKELKTVNGSGAVTESHNVGYFDADNIYVNGNRTGDTYVLTRGTGSGATTCLAGNPCTAKFVYDARDRLIRHEPRSGKGTDYKLDEPARLVGDTTVRAGDVTTQITNGQTTTQRYAGGRLVDVSSGGVTSKYWYDEWGNIDCITAAAGSQANCNPASGTAPSANLLADYHHDELNRMDGLRQYSGGTQTDVTTYTLDAMDRVTSETEDHTGTDNDRTTTFTYQGLSPLLTEERQSGGVDPKTKTYSYDNFGHRLGMTDTNAAGTASTYSYSSDVHGSISQLIDDSGNVKASYGYTPYGGADAPSTDTEALTNGDTNSLRPLNPMRFSGKRADSGTASSSTAQPDYDMGARRFGPTTGRFLQQDAFAGALSDLGLATDPLTQNRYALAAGNPISYMETDGHMLIADGGGGGSTTPAPPPPDQEPADKEEEPSAAERFFKTAASDIWNGIKGTKDVVVTSFRCEYTDNQDGCDEFNDQLERQFTTKEGWKETWNAVKEPFEKDCRSMDTAPECAGHVASALFEVLAGKGAGKLDNLVGRPGDGKPNTPDSCKNSFSPDTLVVMADGSTKKIKDVKIGDKVLATDPETGRTRVRTVTLLHINEDAELTELTVRTPDGATIVVKSTQHHPFWDETTRAWVDAALLRPGHRLRHASAGVGAAGAGSVTVVGTRNFTGLQHMFDLTVAVDHTYYVLAGDTPVLVHNCPKALNPAEQATLSRMQTLFPSENLRAVNAPDADFIGASGKFDAMGAPGAFSNWASQRTNFMNQIPRHAYKSDFGVVDMTGASQSQIKEVMDFYGTLDSATQNRLIVINGTDILN